MLNYKTRDARELKKVKGSKRSGSGAADVHTSKWPYFTSLDAFLRDQIVPRQSISTLVRIKFVL